MQSLAARGGRPTMLREPTAVQMLEEDHALAHAHLSEIRCTDGFVFRRNDFPSVAYPSKRDQTKSAALERRQTISVPIGGLFYEVGPDVALAADSFRASQMHDRFTDTPEYLALLRGALRMMNAPEIDLLVVGLPVALLTLRKTSLEKAMTGIHDVGGGRRVVVKKAMVMAQPQGALVYYATATNRLAAMQDLPSLVVDPGGRTFDWLVSRGMRLVQKKSHSLNRGGLALGQARSRPLHLDQAGCQGRTPAVRPDQYRPKGRGAGPRPGGDPGSRCPHGQTGAGLEAEPLAFQLCRAPLRHLPGWPGRDHPWAAARIADR